MKDKIFVLILMCLFLSGCQTLKGLKYDIVNFPQSIKDGWNWMKQADEKLAEHLW